MEQTGDILRPLAQAWRLAQNPVALGALAALALVAAGNQFVIIKLAESQNVSNLGTYNLVSGFALILFLGGIIWVLGRKLPGGGGSQAVPSALFKFMVLLAVYGVVRSAMRGLANVAAFGLIGTENVQLVAALSATIPSILLCPIIVRLMALAAPAAQPRLGLAVTALWSSHFAYLAAYAALLVLPQAVFFGLQSLPLDLLASVPKSAAALVQGLVIGAGQVFTLLIAAAAVRDLAPTGARTAEVFS